MASSTAALVSTPTAEVFNHSLPLPLGLVVPLADTDIVGPSSAPLLLHLDIPLSRRKAPATTATSPYPKTNAVPTAGNRAKPRSPTPIRRDTSPLSEDETYPPPSAARITIPRPVGVQRSVEAYLTVPLTQLLAIKKALTSAATDKLELAEPISRQDPQALSEFKAIMHTKFPILLDYEGDWALVNLTSQYLKNAQAQSKKHGAKHRLAAVNAALAS